jgi:hypothetical protein
MLHFNSLSNNHNLNFFNRMPVPVLLCLTRFPVYRFTFLVLPIPIFVSRFPFPVSRFPILDSRSPLPVSRLPFPDSRFPFLDSRFIAPPSGVGGLQFFIAFITKHSLHIINNRLSVFELIEVEVKEFFMSNS